MPLPTHKLNAAPGSPARVRGLFVSLHGDRQRLPEFGQRTPVLRDSVQLPVVAMLSIVLAGV
ncbi:MAG: hypothetical protein WB586_00880 [Chthoniobacterales bacterium]